MSKHRKFTNDDLLRLLLDNDTCKEFLFQQRWKGKPWCPECGYTHIISKATKNDKYKFKCANKRCNTHFTLTSRTIFESSRSDLKDWFKVIYCCTKRNGYSTISIAKELETEDKKVAYGTVLAMHHRIQMVMGIVEKINKPSTGIWEVDYKFHGPDLAKASRAQRAKYANVAGTNHCIPLQFAYKRSTSRSKTVCTVMPRHTKAKQDIDKIRTIISRGSVVNTDAARLFNGYRDYFKQHVVLNQSAGVHSNGKGGHIAGVNQECSQYNRFKKIYVQMSNQYLSLYLNEFMFHRNNSDLSHAERFLLVLKHIEQTFTKAELAEEGRKNLLWIRENVRMYDNMSLDFAL